MQRAVLVWGDVDVVEAAVPVAAHVQRLAGRHGVLEVVSERFGGAGDVVEDVPSDELWVGEALNDDPVRTDRSPCFRAVRKHVRCGGVFHGQFSRPLSGAALVVGQAPVFIPNSGGVRNAYT